MKLQGDDTRVLALSLGALTGVRSMSGVAVLAHRAGSLDIPGGIPLLGDSGAARLATILAGAESVADKLPGMPARSRPLPLAGRAAFGAFAGLLVAAVLREKRLAPAVIGAAAAVATAIGATWLRQTLTERTRVPGPVLGAVEDAVVLAGTGWVARQIRRRQRDMAGQSTRREDVARFAGSNRDGHTRDDRDPDDLMDDPLAAVEARDRAPVAGRDAPPPEPRMVDEIIDETFPASDPAPWWGGTVEPIDRAYGDPDSEDGEFGEPGRSEIT